MRAEQLRAARGMVRWSQAELAQHSGVSPETIKRLEGLDGILRIRLDTLMKIQRTLEAEGVEFIPENGGGAGVRMRKKSDSA